MTVPRLPERLNGVPSQTEVWQRGPVAGYDPYLMPVVHALLQAREDLERLAADVPAADVWQRPGGAASAGFHVRHAAGSLDRLLTYARGEQLSAEQMTFLRSEGEADTDPDAATSLAGDFARAIERTLAQIAATPEDSLLQPRGVGRAQLPSTVLGLFFHAAEHTQRHMGQMVTTLKV